MQFTLNDLKELLVCIRNNDLQIMTVKKDNLEIIISREIINTERSPIAVQSNNPKSISQQLGQKNTRVRKDSQKISSNKKKTYPKEAEIYFTIVSPMVGTFYRSPSPNEAAFIELHDSAKINQTVCIIEAMKLMNEIEAEVGGKIVEILVEDGDIVDCGQPLMKIKPQ
uniref:Biotin carboxyl carrier protein of acetyl-CoA carboxylase n=1 Tax=Scinaia undulata TaxID=1884664 RepID=A0A1G4NXP0_9FLOR|nr:Acetyl-CoA carboxylase, biotin carboxyl carrier protein [Scinaia undulata]SCW23422.1 Acetyl-CoA carboxylase, biotin carboxyl carrier protein [Scinaia undulata]